MRTTSSLILLAAILSVSSSASADVPNDDCGSKSAGDECETYDGKTGACEERDGELFCNTAADADEGCSASASRSGELPGLVSVVLGAGILVLARRRR